LSSSAQRKESEAPVSFFDPGFSAVKNDLLKLVYENPAVPPATRLLLLIARYSTGYLRHEVVLGETFILHETGMSHASLYRAKAELVTSGQIVVKHTRSGCCVYRLTDSLQSLKANPSLRRDPNPSLRRDPSLYKENLENLDQHHHDATTKVDDEISIDSSTTSSWREAIAPELTDTALPLDASAAANSHIATPEKAVPCAEVSGEFRRPAPPASPAKAASSALARRLQDVGVNAFMARRLAGMHAEPQIEAALKRLHLVPGIQNPAGYLVAELSRGGYAEPVDPLRAATDRQEKVHQMRQAERQAADEERLASNARQVTAPLEHFQDLPTADQSAILLQLEDRARAEGFDKLRGWGPSHPVSVGLLAELVRAHRRE